MPPSAWPAAPYQGKDLQQRPPNKAAAVEMMLQLSTAERCCCNFNCKANTGKAAGRHAVAAKAASKHCCCNFNCKANTGKAAERHAVAAKVVSNYVSCIFATKCHLQPPAAAKGFKVGPAPNCL
jgi:hypothetical protein